ncbi:MAG: DUF87 domain-containing protein [Candidatus Sericytochromatia bacterium]
MNPEAVTPAALGTVIEGSLSGGLRIRLSPACQVEDIRVGQFVVVEGQRNRFFCMITDVELAASNPRILLDPPEHGSFLAEVLQGTGTFGIVALQPMLMLTRGESKIGNAGEAEELRPVKTIPNHFAPAHVASARDFGIVFGNEDEKGKNRFAIGQPLDMDIPLCLDLDRFVERSNAIFGKSGTGKSFLTRLVLSGIIKKSVAVNLIFDMHNEYGWQALSENKGEVVVKGLRQLFGKDVAVFTLDLESSRQRGVKDAHELSIPLEEISIEDLALIKNELNLSEASIESAMILEEIVGRKWLSQFMTWSNNDIDDFVTGHKGHAGALKALQRKLQRILRLSYIKDISVDSSRQIMQYLEHGKHVILEFGGQNSLLSYMLVTNILTRKIHARYVEISDYYNADPQHREKPRQLVITIEEAHKFLSPQISKSTIFGTIAREMRKYHVTLLIVDQRPSSIDTEVLSQVGTRITALLNDDKDIDAVFTGVSGSQSLRTVLAQLDPKQQALILGYAVPMPVVMRTRAYDTAFYKAMGFRGDDKPEEVAKRAQDNIIRLFPG